MLHRRRSPHPESRHNPIELLSAGEPDAPDICVPKCNPCELCDEDGNCLVDPSAECLVCPGGRCDDQGNCDPLDCGLQRADYTELKAFSLDDVTFDVKVTCAPDCPDAGPVFLTYEFDPAGGSNWSGSPGSADCPAPPDTFTLQPVTITVGPTAEPSELPYYVVITGALKGTECATLTIPVQVIGPDLDLQGLLEANEFPIPGGFVPLNSDDDGDGQDGDCIPDLEQTLALGREVAGEDDLKDLTLRVIGFDPAGEVLLYDFYGDEKINLYKQSGDSRELITLPHLWKPSQDPFPSSGELGKLVLRVEGKLASQASNDIYLRMNYTAPAGSRYDRLRFSVVEVDLDVDSNNHGTIDPNNTSAGTDDKIEAKPLYPTASCAPNFAGKWLWPNNDDSDGNGMSDNQAGTVGGVPIDDTLVINGPNDLSEDVVQFVIRPVKPPPPAGWSLYLELENPETVRVFDYYGDGAPAIMGPGMLSSVSVPKAVNGWTFGFEGVQPGTTTLSLVLKDQSLNEICRDKVRVTVIGLEVKWETPQDVEITEPNEYYITDPFYDQAFPTPVPTFVNQPLGVRYFPDATVSGGLWNDFVTVKVTTDPPVVGVTVYLKAIDPDDPSAGVPANVVDDDLLGPDNADATLPGFYSGVKSIGLTHQDTVSDAGGLIVDFRVPHQPGDNFRVAATLKQAALGVVTEGNVPPSGTSNPATDAQVPLFIGNISPLLTIWRYYNIEVDSMDQETPEDPEQYGVFQLTHGVPNSDLMTLDAYITGPENYYEGGPLIQVGTGQTWTIVRHSAAAGTIVYPDSPFNLGYGSVHVFDDDPRPGYPLFPQLPVTTVVSAGFKHAYAAAFLEAREVPLAMNPRRSSDFATNLDNGEIQFYVQTCSGPADIVDAQGTDSYWARHVIFCYQPDTDADGDHDSMENCAPYTNCVFPVPYNTLGLTPLAVGADDAQYGITGQSVFCGQHSFIFAETIRDLMTPDGGVLWQIVAHESGHATAPGISEEQEHAEGGLMAPGRKQNTPSDQWFAPATLKRFRTATRY